MHLVDTDNRPQDVSVCRECGPGWSIEDPQAAFMEQPFTIVERPSGSEDCYYYYYYYYYYCCYCCCYCYSYCDYHYYCYYY